VIDSDVEGKPQSFDAASGHVSISCDKLYCQKKKKGVIRSFAFLVIPVIIERRTGFWR
jgi:hypothetical protein